MAGQKGVANRPLPGLQSPRARCGSSVFWGQARRSRERPGSLRSTITPCVGIGGTTFRLRPAPPMSRELERAKISSRRSSRTSLWGCSTHYRIIRGALYKSLSAAAELGDSNSLALLAGRLHENFRDCGRLTGELQRGPLLNIQNNVLVNPDYTRAIARLVSAVSPYPEAREAVIAALRDLDAQGSSPPALADRRDERTAND